MKGPGTVTTCRGPRTESPALELGYSAHDLERPGLGCLKSRFRRRARHSQRGDEAATLAASVASGRGQDPSEAGGQGNGKPADRRGRRTTTPGRVVLHASSRFYILCSSYKNPEQCPILCGEGQVGVEGGGGGVGRVRSQPRPEGRRPSLGCVGEVEGVGPLCLWLRRHGEEMQPRVQHEKHGVVTVRFPRGDTLQSGGSWGAT